MDLAQAFAEMLDGAGNRVLALDPQTLARSAALQGKVIGIELLGVGQTFYVCPDRHGLRIASAWDGAVDVRLRGSPFAFAGILRDPRSVRAGAASIAVTGDGVVAEEFARLLAGFEIDWEEQLSRWVGDLPARKIGNLARSLSAWTGELPATLARDVGEFLQEESRLLTSRVAAARFMDDVDGLRAAVERLEKRVERLERRGP